MGIRGFAGRKKTVRVMMMMMRIKRG